MNRLSLIANCGWKVGSQLPILRQSQHLLPNQKLLLSTTTTLRSTSNRKTDLNSNTDTAQREWRQIYRLPLVTMAAAFNRLKIYQGSLTILGVPLAIVLEQAGHISTETSGIFAAIGVSGAMTLALCSLAVTNLIGFVYVNPAGNQLKLAYVDYWGRRREAVVDVDDVKLLWDEPKLRALDFFRSVHLHSDAKRKFKLLNSYGIIVDRDVFTGVFGS